MNLLKKIREENKKTQGDLSKELGISQSALSQMEAAGKVPSMKIFLKLVGLKYINESNIFSIVKELVGVENDK